MKPSVQEWGRTLSFVHKSSLGCVNRVNISQMKIGIILLQLLLIVWATPLFATLTLKEVPLKELKPTREQRQSTLIINNVVGKYHYKKSVLDDGMSAAILERYLESLDANRRYFTQKDVDRFTKKYRSRLDDSLRGAMLEPAFEIFITYRMRMEERVSHALELLGSDFNFKLDEVYRFDREDVPWAANKQELDEMWRKRVKNDVLGLKLTGKKIKEIKTTLRKRYGNTLHRTRQLASNDVYQLFINAYTQTIEPHTSYMLPRLAENFDISMRLSLEGIGAVLTVEDEYTVVLKTVPGGPAGQSGLVHPGDRITGVGQGNEGEVVDVVGWRLQDVVDLIRGPKGSVVRLQIVPEEGVSTGLSKTIVLVRNKIKLEDQAAKKSIIENPGGRTGVRIGVVDIPAFYRDFDGASQGNKDFRSTTRDVRKILKELAAEKVDGIVIDLRQNGGGSLTEATELTGLFIPSGPVVQVKDSTGSVDVERDTDPEQVYAGPLAVLVDRYSASASEIFAGAIQDYGRGIIIGEPTFGKGTVQTLIDLGRFVHNGGKKLGRLRLTMAQFFRIDGASTQFRGVVPDIIYPTASDSNDEGERSLDNALPWASIKALDHARGNLGPFDIYRSQHKNRIKSDVGFDYLVKQSEVLKKIRDEKVVSLNEEKRKQSWEQRKQANKDRKNRFFSSIGVKPADDGEDDQIADVKRKSAVEADLKVIREIGVKEAARILTDYITKSVPRAVMANQLR
jgi:carboxyl-terminal processing protease